jgi:hypothetical protein
VTPRAFINWLYDMKNAGIAKTDKQAMELLGMHENSAKNMKAKGADHRTALACAALLNGIGAYDGND